MPCERLKRLVYFILQEVTLVRRYRASTRIASTFGEPKKTIVNKVRTGTIGRKRAEKFWWGGGGNHYDDIITIRDRMSPTVSRNAIRKLRRSGVPENRANRRPRNLLHHLLHSFGARSASHNESSNR